MLNSHCRVTFMDKGYMMQKKLLAMLGMSIVLTGCSQMSYDQIYGSQPTTNAPTQTQQPQTNQPEEAAKDVEPETTTTQEVAKPELSQLQDTASQLTANMLNSSEIAQVTASGAPVLYVGTINNASSQYVDTKALTDSIANQIYISGQFQSVDPATLDEVRSQLSLTSDEELPDLNSAIEYGKMLGAKYMLFSQVTDNGSKYGVAMRMMDLSSGLIAWKGNL